MNTTTTDIEARNKRICATYKSHRAKPSKHSRHRGNKADALMMTARIWKMPIREVRNILETAEAVKLGVDPKTYITEKTVERFHKKSEWQKEKDSLIRQGYVKPDANDVDPYLTRRLISFLGI